MKIIPVIIIALLLSSCRVDGWEINQASIICKDHGGISYLKTSNYTVVCLDGHSAVRSLTK